LSVGSEQVLKRPVPFAGFAQENPACLFENLSPNHSAFVDERAFGQIVMKNAVSDFEQAFWANGLGPSGTEGRKCSFALALEGAAGPGGYWKVSFWERPVNAPHDVPRNVGDL